MAKSVSYWPALVLSHALLQANAVSSQIAKRAKKNYQNLGNTVYYFQVFKTKKSANSES